jgi:hypothetical protein
MERNPHYDGPDGIFAGYGEYQLDRDEIERRIATEPILPGENVNDKAKRILANYEWKFVPMSPCSCGSDDNRGHALSCGYWPDGIVGDNNATK